MWLATGCKMPGRTMDSLVMGDSASFSESDRENIKVSRRKGRFLTDPSLLPEGSIWGRPVPSHCQVSADSLCFRILRHRLWPSLTANQE